MKQRWPRLRARVRPTIGPTRLNLPVFIAASLIIGLVAAAAILAPAATGAALAAATAQIATWMGWFYIALATAILVFVLWLALSRFGRLRLGPDDSRPRYSMFTWAAMLFAAGIGTDILFFSVAEPLSHYLAPPGGEAETVAAARQAVVWTLFHYGVTGWGMYCLVGVALGYFAYRHGLALAVRSALYPLIGRRIHGPIGDAVDAAAVIGTIFGVAASLGIGVVQLSFGLSLLAPIPAGLATQIALVALAVVMAALSATTGLDRGIRLLSELNVVLGIILCTWVLFSGRTSFLLATFVTNVGDYFARFAAMTLDTMSYLEGGSDWLAAWTLFFWAWWMAWASFVGMFLARISRGRTIREFVFGSLIIPLIYVALWINIFGDDAIDLVRSGNQRLREAEAEQGIYYLLQAHPGASFTIGLALTVGLLFYVTSADSGALVMTNLCSTLADPEDDGPRGVRIYWAVLIGVVTVATLAVGGIAALQHATIIMAVPFSLVLIAIMVALVRAMRDEDARRDFYGEAVAPVAEAPGGSSGVSWSQRLATAIAVVEPEQARAALAAAVVPALADVAALLGPPARMDRELDGAGQLNAAWLLLEDGADSFSYRVEITLAPSPAFAGHMVRRVDRSARLEVRHSAGRESYDVMGLSRDQVRHDIIDAYESFLAMRPGEQVDQA